MEKDKKLGILLIVAGVLIGSGVGQILSTPAKSVTGAASVIGLGVGFIAAFIYAMVKKK